MKDRKHKSYFLNKLKDEIKNAETATLTTVSLEGKLKSRPVPILEMDNSGALWFFTNEFTGRVNEIAKHPLVCVSYSNSKIKKYVSVTGEATIVNNQIKIKELWHPLMQKWFPEGLSDPQLALLKINIDTAEYWDALSNKMLLIPEIMETLAVKESRQKAKKGSITALKNTFMKFIIGSP